MGAHLIRATAAKIPLADESVQCVVTSPPYWGLRKYAGQQDSVWGGAADCEHEFSKAEQRMAGGGYSDKSTLSGFTNPNTKGREMDGGVAVIYGVCLKCGAWRGAFGLEPTVELYVEHTIQILREIRRVLRKDGVVFYNLGDSYCAARGYSGSLDTRIGDMQRSVRGSIRGAEQFYPHREPQIGLKSKDLVLMPFRVALAAQADGWWVRSIIAWVKPNPMPESVTDRPTDAWEPILMLTKSEKYFWDAEAVRERATAGWNGSSFTDERDQAIYKNLGAHSRGKGNGGPKAEQREREGTFENWADNTREVLSTRHMRNVWMFATQPYSGAHFATFPEELPRRCITAATSERGTCRFCGTPWKRVVESVTIEQSGSGKAGNRPNGKKAGETQVREDHDVRMGPCVESRTVGWQPGCLCKGQRGKTMPCIVLDPFAGSGTTGRVAIKLNRRAILLDVAYHESDNPLVKSYAELAKERTSKVQRNLTGMF